MLKLDTARNSLLFFEAIFGLSSMCFTMGTLVSGFFGVCVVKFPSLLLRLIVVKGVASINSPTACQGDLWFRRFSHTVRLHITCAVG